MSTIVTRSGKGSALTHAEVDANFTNLNNDKAEITSALLPVYVSTSSTLTTHAITLNECPSTGGSTYRLTTLSRFNRIRLNTRVNTLSASANTPIIFMQHSLDASSWTTIGSGSGTDVISLSSTGFKETGWMTLPSAAIAADVYFRVAMQGGDGTASPVVRGLSYTFARA